MSARTATAPPVVIMAAHFPPPVHGHSMSAAGMGELLDARATVIRCNIAAPGLDRDARYHLRRLRRVLAAMAVIVFRGRSARSVYISGDGGRGMLYTLFLVAAARATGRPTYLHHMAYSFLTTKSRVMSAVVAVGGPRVVHLGLCERMARDLVAVYDVADARVCPVSFTIEDPGWTATLPRSDGPLRLGHFGNLTVEKGLGRVFETLGELERRGVPCRLVVGGPAIGEEARRTLAAGMERFGAAVTYVGPVTGAGRDKVLGDCDVFLFPTLYANESFGLVVWEAMLRGIPVISYRAGCLDSDAIGAGGLVLEPAVTFAAGAAALCEEWMRQPDAYLLAARSAGELAHAARGTARRHADAMAARMVSG